MKSKAVWFGATMFLVAWLAACGQRQETTETAEQPAAAQEEPAQEQPSQPEQPARETSARPAASQRKLAEAQQPSEPTVASELAGQPSTAEDPAAPQPMVVKVPRGTRIHLALNDALSTKTSQVGDAFSGRVSRPVAVNDLVPIPMGSTVHGAVTKVERPGRVKGRAQLALRFERIELPDGRSLEMAGTLSALGDEEKETVGQEGEVEGEGSRGRDAATIGGGAGVGAIIGGITGGKKGAAIGAGTGAAAGTAVTLLTRGKDVELKRGSEVAVDLSEPLSVQIK